MSEVEDEALQGRKQAECAASVEADVEGVNDVECVTVQEKKRSSLISLLMSSQHFLLFNTPL